MRILMVCLGNICRSPMAEGILRHKIRENGLDWIVDSAATESYHIGEPPFHYAQQVCLRHGIDISAKRARKFMKQDLAIFDKVYALAEDVYYEMKAIAGAADMQNADLLMNELHPGMNESVPDPYHGNEMNFIAAYDMINRACDAIIKNYNQ